MKKHILTTLLLLVILSLKAQHTITREKFSIVIAYDTFYVGEEYTLYVDLGKAVNAEVKRNSMSVSIDGTNKAQVKFKTAAVHFDKNGNSMQLMRLTVKINDEVINENVPYVVKKLPIKEHSKQDSVSDFLSKNEAYKKVQTSDNVLIYDDFIKYLKQHLPIESHVGQLSMAVVINSQGHVERYDCIKNSYTGIAKDEFDKVILAYRISPNMMGKFGFKFGLEVFSFQGHPNPVFYGHGFIMK
jgi:hypothetical protein